MIGATTAILLSVAVLLALAVNLVLKPARSSRLSTVCLLTGFLGGIVYYAGGYWELSHDLLMTVARAPLMVMRMFLGVNELSAIAGSRLVSSRAGLFCFWMLHLAAFYSTASAAMTTLGAEALRRLRYLLSRRGNLTLIYGINDNSIALGRECQSSGESSVLFVAERASAPQINDLALAGMSVIVGPSAVACDRKTIRRLHIGKRKLSVYAMDVEEDRNLRFALRLRDALREAGIPAENLRVTLPGAEDILASLLQVTQEHYGFGYVNVFDRSMLTARALIRTCPPWESLRFTPDGRAAEDYECVVIGFGPVGQAVLRQLVMNAQFVGSRFHAAVFSSRFDAEAGFFLADSPELLRQYDIVPFRTDADSLAFYTELEKRLSTLKLIAVCTGSEEENRRISDELMLYCAHRHAEHICVARCGERGVQVQERVGSPILTANLYTRAFLSAEDADRSAILLNATYNSSPNSDWEKWVACDSFGKMSSRASADFMPAFLRIAGVSREELTGGKWQPSRSLLETLGETEHLRWNAFHFANGYRTMSREEFEQNAAAWRRCREEGKPCGIKIAKDAENRKHACLIPWEDLDELSARENAVTGRGVDYKQTDINNVLTLPQLLRAEDAKRVK